MKRKNINLKCYNKYCVFNRDNECIREETVLNRIGICENMFLINANQIENLQELKINYLKNMLEPTDETMQDDVDWFHKQMEAKEVHPLELILEEATKLLEKEKGLRNNLVFFIE